jgi:hypothetical protein
MDEPPESAIAGLCADCGHARKLKTKIDAIIYMCGLSAKVPRLPKFPRLPVIACAGYEKTQQGL